LKKINIFCIALVIILTFSACSLKKSPITAQNFTNKAESLGYTINNVTSQYEGSTVNSLLAVEDDKNFQIEFHEVETQAQASGAFSENKKDFDETGSGMTTSSSGSNWARYSKTAGGIYGIVSYIDNTFIYARVPEEHKQAVIDFFKELGY